MLQGSRSLHGSILIEFFFDWLSSLRFYYCRWHFCRIWSFTRCWCEKSIVSFLFPSWCSLDLFLWSISGLWWSKRHFSFLVICTVCRQRLFQLFVCDETSSYSSATFQRRLLGTSVHCLPSLLRYNLKILNCSNIG